MKSDREVLEEAIELLDSPEHWTQGAYARDARGESLFPGHEGAVSWCSTGALYLGLLGTRARRVDHDQQQQIERIVSLLGFSSILDLIQFNDTHSYDEVILQLKRGLDNLP